MTRAFLAIAFVATAAFAADAAPRYSSGPVPERFDMHVAQTSKVEYEADGASYTFDTLIAAIKQRGAANVLLQGRGTPQDVLCASTLGIETGSKVFLIGSDGRPKALSWSADDKEAAKAARVCRS